MGDVLMNDDQLDSIADTQLLESMVRVEEGIKHQNENLEKMMIQSDRRFTNLSETMDKRFNRLYTFLSGMFLTILAGMITLIIQNLQG